MDFKARMNKVKSRLGSVSPTTRAKLPPAVQKLLEETAMLIRIAEEAAGVGHEPWCAALGIAAPADCDCVLADVYQEIKTFCTSDPKRPAELEVRDAN